MPADYYPKREREIVTFTENFSAGIAASPRSFGLSPAQAAEYAAVQHVFADLQQKSTQGSTNTSSVVAAKKNARRALEQLTRELVRIARMHPGVTAAQRRTLGLPVRDPGRPRGSRNVNGEVQMNRIGPPRVHVNVLNGRTLRIELRDRFSLARCKPRGVEGATVFSYVGEHPPAAGDMDKWRFERNTTKLVTTVRPGNRDAMLPPGTKVWVMACWMNRRSQRGPASEPVSTHTQYGVEYTNWPQIGVAA